MSSGAGHVATQPAWQARADKDVLLKRALMLKKIRAFFDARSVIEVETPLLSHACTTDPHLDSLQSQFRDQRCYLNTSPEFAMKRLLASWRTSIYQICKAFRDDELGTYHNPEFTMLEWYRLDFDCENMMDELTELIVTLCGAIGLSGDGNNGQNKPSFHRISYQQAFAETLGINPHRTTSAECYAYARDNNVEIPRGLTEHDDVNDWLDWLLTQRVLPAFEKSAFSYLYDYPESQCALAKITTNEQGIAVASRFELFYGEIELANGFHELTDPVEQLQRFKQENKARIQHDKVSASIDNNFIDALAAGLPECTGLALGLDRLLMILAGEKEIEKVLSFSWRNA